MSSRRGRIDVMVVSARLARWITSHYGPGSADRVIEELERLPWDFGGGQDSERIGAALVLGGSWTDFEGRLRTARIDWRDLLVGAGLGDEDWPERVEAQLGSR